MTDNNSRLIKPLVFLSHSKGDAPFIKKLDADLRRCQIDTWLDEYEIRHGEPWLDEIFQNGMPACNAILVYLTDTSIDSNMVRKEMDAALIRKLKDTNVAFLPYVQNVSLRERLRADIQSLQVPVLNDDNYEQVLPCIVSNIWRAFLSQMVTMAVQSERVARLEAENRLLEIESNQSGSIFSEGESKGFRFIKEQLDRFESVKIELLLKEEKVPSVIAAQFNVCSVLPKLSGANNFTYEDRSVWGPVVNAATDMLQFKKENSASYKPIQFPSLSEELLRYGFLSRQYKGRKPPSSKSPVLDWFLSRDYDLVITEKLERFKYWLAVEGDYPSAVEVKDVSVAKEPDGECESNNGQAS